MLRVISMGYMYLAIAVIAEVIATVSLKASNGFSNVVPSILVVVGYAVAFYCLSLLLKVMPVGIAYAMWAGLGIVLAGVVSAIIFKQIPDWPAVVGMLLIISGVIVIHAFSKTVGH